MATYYTFGETQHFIVRYDSSLVGLVGPVPFAVAVLLESCEADYARTQAWFGGIELSHRIAIQFETELTLGFCGGNNNETDLIELACNENNPPEAQSTFVAELAEVFMAAQNKGWRGINSKGEGLSRFLGWFAYPSRGGISGDETNWLDSSRGDYLKVNDDNIFTVSSPPIGCAILFLNYLLSQLGFSLMAIITAGGGVLNDVYRNLTNDSASPFGTFSGLLAAKFPPGQSSFPDDHPFPIPNDSRLSLRQFLRTQGMPHPSVRTLVAQANVGNVRALINTERPAALV